MIFINVTLRTFYTKQKYACGHILTFSRFHFFMFCIYMYEYGFKQYCVLPLIIGRLLWGIDTRRNIYKNVFKLNEDTFNRDILVIYWWLMINIATLYIDWTVYIDVQTNIFLICFVAYKWLSYKICIFFYGFYTLFS